MLLCFTLCNYIIINLLLYLLFIELCVAMLTFRISLDHNCDRLRENRAQRGMRRHRKKIDLVLKIVLNKPNEGNG